LTGDLFGPLDHCRLATQATTAAYASPPLVGLSCHLLWAAISPVVPWTSGLSSNRCTGAGRRPAGLDEQSELEIPSAFLWLTLSCRVTRGLSHNTNSAGTLEGQSARSIGFSGHKGLLILCQPPLLSSVPAEILGKAQFCR
jgi:hypothetical protein